MRNIYASNSFRTADVTINADGTCGAGWVCEHRWNAITKMVYTVIEVNTNHQHESDQIHPQVKFRNVAVGQPMRNYFNNGDLVAFSRGNVAFFAMAKEGQISQLLQTG